jgi:hypothetical protein
MQADPALAAVIADNQPTLDLLVEQIRRRGVIPLVGAGLSRPLYPEWTTFLLESAANAGVEPALRALIDAGQYEEAADALLDAVGDTAFQDLMASTFGPEKLRDQPCPGAAAALPALVKGPVITTNFDRVLEKAFSDAGQPFERTIRGTEIDTFGRVFDHWLPYLLKLHGDADDRTHRVLTAGEYHRRYDATVDGSSTATVSAQLERILIRGQLLFLGCSLNADRVLTLLAAVNLRYGNIVHYAVVQRPVSNDAFVARSLFLSRRGIRPIWYPTGEHALVEGLIRYLAEKAAARASVAPAREVWEEGADRTDVISASLGRLLAGRDDDLKWLDQRVERGGITIVTGEPGVGKSALLAHWIGRRRSSGDAVAAHFFNEQQGVSSIVDACFNLLRQVHASRGSTAPTPVDRDEAVVRGSLYDLLRQEDRPGPKRLVIVLDALDEADGTFWPPVGSLASSVSLVVAAREEPRERIEPWLEVGQRRTLSALESSGIAEWLRAAGAGQLAACADDPAFVESVRAKTAGLTLYLQFLIDDMLAAQRDGQSAATVLERSPAGFDNYMRAQFARLAKDREALRGKDVQQLFALLAVAAGPLPEDVIESLTGMNAIELQRLPLRVTRWLTLRVSPERLVEYAFSHPLLADQFARSLGSLAAQSRARLIDFCRQWATHGHEYALRFFPDQLLKAERWPELFELARDEAYMARQRAALPLDPGLPLRAGRLALDGALKTADPAAIAEFMLRHARHLRSTLASRSPLDALRTTGLPLAFQIADLHDTERRVLWHLLLASELAETGRSTDARLTLDRLKRIELPSVLSSWQPVVAVVLLSRIIEAGAAGWDDLPSRLLDQSALEQLCADLSGGVRFDVALDIARRQAGDAAGEAWVLRLRTEAQAARGDVQDALATVGRFADSDASEPHRAYARLAVFRAQLQTGDRIGARETLGAVPVQPPAADASLLAAVAVGHAQLGEVERAVAIAGRISDASSLAAAIGLLATTFGESGGASLASLDALTNRLAGDDRERALAAICEAHIVGGNIEAARQVFSAITNGSLRVWLFGAGAAALARNGDDRAAEHVASTIGNVDAETLIRWRIAEAQAQAGRPSVALASARGIPPLPLGDLFPRDRALRQAVFALGRAGEIDAAVRAAKDYLHGAQRPIALVDIARHEWQAGRGAVARHVLASALEVQLEKTSQNTRLAQLVDALAEAHLFAEAFDISEKIPSFLRGGTLTGIAKEQARAGHVVEAAETFRRAETLGIGFVAGDPLLAIVEAAAKAGRESDAREFADRLTFPFYRVKALTAIARSQVQAGEPDRARATLAEALTSVEQAPDYDRDDLLREVTEAQAAIESGAANAMEPSGGEHAQSLESFSRAVEDARAITDAYQQASALEKIAIGMARSGFGEDAARTAGMLPANRAAALPRIAEALAHPRDARAFARLVGLAASDEEAAWNVCLLLPRVYPDHGRHLSRAIEEWLRHADA